MSNKHAKPSTASAEAAGLAAFFRQSFAIVDVELRKVARDPTEIFSRAIQPILWLVIFGQVFERVHGISTGRLSYTAFLAPGILAQSILFSAIFFGIAVIWERDLGIVHKLLVSPAYRSALVFGKAAAAGIRGIGQAVLIYALVFVMRIELRFEWMPLIGVLAAVMAGSAIFATFSLWVACLVKTRERFLGIGQLLTMPLFFASNAIYPLAIMPGWLRVVSRLNPLTYLVDVLRGLMIQGGQSVHGVWTDFGVLGLVFIILLMATARIYPSIIR